MFRFNYLLSAGAISLLVSAMAFAEEVEPGVLVEVDNVVHEQIAEHIYVPGTVISRYDAEIAAEIAGRLHFVADVGELIEKDGLLAQLDVGRLMYQQTQNNANVSKWQARVSLLKKKLERFQTMRDSHSVSQDQLDEAVSELEVASQELAQAQSERDMTNYQIAHSEVRAPFTALVVSRLQSPGEYTGIGQSIVRVVDPTQVEASIRAPLTVAPFIEQGMTVDVSDRRQSGQALVRAIVPVGDEQSRTMELRVSLQPASFAIGSAVRVALPHSDAHKGVTVPRDALVLRKAGSFIFQVNEEGMATQIAVTTGIGVGDRIEVFGDVSSTDPVITRGAERLQAGQKVRIQQEPTLTASMP